MITFIDDIKFKIKSKLYKQNSIRVIAVLPNGEILEEIRIWENNKINARMPDIRHENLIEEKLMEKLIKKGYSIPTLLETRGMLSRYPLMAGLIREYSIAFILKSNLVRHNYDIVISCIPSEITKEQYVVVNKMNGNNIDSIAYDDGKDFAIIDKPLESFVKNRMK